MPTDLPDLLAPVLARLDAIDARNADLAARVEALRPPPAPTGEAATLDAPTFEKIAAAYTRQTLALGEAQDAHAAAIKEAEGLREKLAAAEAEIERLEANAGPLRQTADILSADLNAAIARAEQAEASIDAIQRATDPRGTFEGSPLDLVRSIVDELDAAWKAADVPVRGMVTLAEVVADQRAKRKEAEAELTRLRTSGPERSVVESARCNLTCPHGDRCRLASGHADGCNHACACNEPNEPGLWVTRSMVRSALRVGVEMTDTADADNLWTVLAAGDDLTKIPSEPKGRAARRDAAPQPAAKGERFVVVPLFGYVNDGRPVARTQRLDDAEWYAKECNADPSKFTPDQTLDGSHPMAGERARCKYAVVDTAPPAPVEEPASPDDPPVTDAEARECVERLGIDVPTWAAEVLAKCEARAAFQRLADAMPEVQVTAGAIGNPEQVPSVAINSGLASMLRRSGKVREIVAHEDDAPAPPPPGVVPVPAFTALAWRKVDNADDMHAAGVPATDDGLSAWTAADGRYMFRIYGRATDEPTARRIVDELHRRVGAPGVDPAALFALAAKWEAGVTTTVGARYVGACASELRRALATIGATVAPALTVEPVAWGVEDAEGRVICPTPDREDAEATADAAGGERVIPLYRGPVATTAPGGEVGGKDGAS